MLRLVLRFFDWDVEEVEGEPPADLLKPLLQFSKLRAALDRCVDQPPTPPNPIRLDAFDRFTRGQGRVVEAKLESALAHFKRGRSIIGIRRLSKGFTPADRAEIQAALCLVQREDFATRMMAGVSLHFLENS